MLRHSIEFIPATPLEYLARWIGANHVFEDDVEIASVIEWADGTISFGITQPQYDGEPASLSEIENYFAAAGWSRIPDKSEQGYAIFYNYAFDLLALDAVPRNCYVRDGHLLPFDIILSHPGKPLADFLAIYP